MAMEFRRRIVSSVRPNNLPYLPTSLRDNSSGSQLPVSRASLSKALCYAVEASGFAYGGWWIYGSNFCGIRQKLEDWKAKKRVLEMLEKLDRGQYQSGDAYLEILDREINAMKARVLERETDLCKINAKAREVAALKSMICAWTSRESEGPSKRNGKKGHGKRNEEALTV